jgi:rod shape-determining protein MreC
LRGQGKGGPPIVGLLDDDVRTRDIEVGDVVSTAGGSDSLAPQDLPIGRVTRVVERGGTSPLLEVEPFADLSRLNFVSVLLYVPASERTS